VSVFFGFMHEDVGM